MRRPVRYGRRTYPAYLLIPGRLQSDGLKDTGCLTIISALLKTCSKVLQGPSVGANLIP
jgi:hypothetical protein